MQWPTLTGNQRRPLKSRLLYKVEGQGLYTMRSSSENELHRTYFDPKTGRTPSSMQEGFHIEHANSELRQENTEPGDGDDV